MKVWIWSSGSFQVTSCKSSEIEKFCLQIFMISRGNASRKLPKWSNLGSRRRWVVLGVDPLPCVSVSWGFSASKTPAACSLGSSWALFMSTAVCLDRSSRKTENRANNDSDADPGASLSISESHCVLLWFPAPWAGAYCCVHFTREENQTEQTCYKANGKEMLLTS